MYLNHKWDLALERVLIKVLSLSTDEEMKIGSQSEKLASKLWMEILYQGNEKISHILEMPKYIIISKCD